MRPRRDVLRTTARGAGVGLLAALAGCGDETSEDGETADGSDDGNEGGDGGDGNGTETDESDENGGEAVDEATTALEYTDWMYDPDEQFPIAVGVQEIDIGSVLSTAPSYVDELRPNETDWFGDGLRTEDIDTAVNVNEAVILSGSFDSDGIIEELSVSETADYGGFEFYEKAENDVTVATDGDVLIGSEPDINSTYTAREAIELLVDTSAGDAANITDENDAFDRIYGANASGNAVFVTLLSEWAAAQVPDDAIVAKHETAAVDSSETTAERRELHKSEDGIDLDEIKSEYEAANFEVESIARDGRTVTIELRVATETYLSGGE